MNSKEKEIKGLELLRDFEYKQASVKAKEVQGHLAKAKSYNQRIKEVTN